MYSTKNSFHFVVASPIIQSKAKYDVYEAITLPVPHSNLSYSAYYKVESDFIAVSKDDISYTYLNQLEVTQCRQGFICHMKTPIFKASQYPSCVIALFKKDQALIDKICQPIVVPMSTTPLVKRLFTGKWLISTPFPFTLTISCDKQGNRVTQSKFSVGIHVVSLRPRCAGYSKYFDFPKFIAGSTEFEIDSLFQKEVVF